MLKRLWSYLVLPKQITEFERTYLKRMNRVGLIFFYLHIPVFMGVAALCKTGVWSALLLTLAVLVGPTIAYRTLSNLRAMSAVFGFTAMCMGGLLVHFGQGAMQIEMHFYFFALLAMLAVFGNPMAILVAAATVAVHHLLIWIVLPSSVFNYDASIWSVAVHALFVVLESVAGCFVARSFFDNVIGLERIVARRTQELDARNNDLRLILDNVEQGFLNLDRAGTISRERSAVVTRWLGPVGDRETFWDVATRSDPRFGAGFKLGWEAVVDDVLPLELAIEQLPKNLTLKDRSYVVEYRPILDEGVLAQVMVVISDVTEQLESARLEVDQKETMRMFERISRDRGGFVEFFEESARIVGELRNSDGADRAEVKRLIHTLKGNSALFGLASVADLCGAIEDRMVEELDASPAGELDRLFAQWQSLAARVTTLLGDRQDHTIEIDAADHDAILGAARRGAPLGEMVQMISAWKLEPTARRLSRVAEQTVALGARLQKPINVRVTPNQLRLAPGPWSGFWASFTHAIRNAVDHGIEGSDERAHAMKPVTGTIEISTFTEGDAFVIEIADDGRGIDWQRVATCAEARGLPHGTRDDLVEALFVDGLTTLERTTELSGRGVGMGAVRRECERRGGVVQVKSEPGRGTKVQYRFAIGSMSEGFHFGAAGADPARLAV